jgi:hypothetical protein
MISRDHNATSLSLGKAHQLFGEQLPRLLNELNKCSRHE